MNVDLQQRGVEFTQLFGTFNHLRPALLEKMPPMQIQRDSSQNGGSFDENAETSSSGDLLENGGGIEEQQGKQDLGNDQSVRYLIYK